MGSQHPLRFKGNADPTPWCKPQNKAKKPWVFIVTMEAWRDRLPHDPEDPGTKLQNILPVSGKENLREEEGHQIPITEGGNWKLDHQEQFKNSNCHRWATGLCHNTQKSNQLSKTYLSCKAGWPLQSRPILTSKESFIGNWWTIRLLFFPSHLTSLVLILLWLNGTRFH